MAAGKWLFLGVLVASPALAVEPQTPKMAPAIKQSTLTQQSVKRSGQEFRRCLEAARKVEQARKDYAEGSGSLTAYYRAQQSLTAAEIAYASVTSNVRGNPELRDYLARRAEVAALERARAEVLSIDVAESEKVTFRDELARYEDALKLARTQLAAAEKQWKTAERGEQFRYLNRRAAFEH